MANFEYDWLADLEYKFKFRCELGHITHVVSKEDVDVIREREVPCEHCNRSTTYIGFEPQKIRQTAQVEYEQNGRKAVAIRNKDGEMQYVSQTKLHYQKTGQVENQYTKGYREHLEKTKQHELLRTEHLRKKRGKASTLTDGQHAIENMVKDMPDGEYLASADGVVAKSK